MAAVAAGTGWANCRVIDFACSQCQRAAEVTCAIASPDGKRATFTARGITDGACRMHFWTADKYSYLHSVDGVSGLRGEWIRSLPCRAEDRSAYVSTVDLWAFPVNIDNQHFALALLDVPGRALHYLDSFVNHGCSESPARLRRIFSWYERFLRLHGGKGTGNGPVLNTKDWRVIEYGACVPQQPVGSGDCGFFVVEFARCLLYRKPWDTVSHAGMRAARAQLAREIRGAPLS